MFAFENVSFKKCCFTHRERNVRWMIFDHVIRKPTLNLCAALPETWTPKEIFVCASNLKRDSDLYESESFMENARKNIRRKLKNKNRFNLIKYFENFRFWNWTSNMIVVEKWRGEDELVVIVLTNIWFVALDWLVEKFKIVLNQSFLMWLELRTFVDL